MGKNIALLYMSAYFAQPAPEGSKNRFLRTQTNEAAVSALWKDPASRPDKIVALCSDTVRTKPTVPAADGSGNKVPTLEYFRDEFLKQLGVQPEQLVAVSVPDSMEEADQTRAISAVLEQVAENDNLYIDLSGGMRDTATLLLIVARYLKDIRMVQTKKVLYSELKGNSSVVRDSTGLYNLMDLITAVDAFFSTGTAQKLKSYLWSEGEKDPVLHTLLTRINQFSEDLALCRVQKLNDDLNQIDQALKKTPKKSQNLTDLFFRLLKDRFSTEFAELLSSGEKALPALVSWCAGHGMYQQALTLLCEQMPEYVCQHIFVQPTPKGWEYLAAQMQNKGKPWVYPLFHFHFCRLTLMQKEYPYTTDLRLTLSRDDAEGNMLFGVANDAEMHDYLDMVLASGQLVIDPAIRPQLEQAALLYQRVMQYRNQINHASASDLGLQSERVLPLDTEHIKETLQKIAAYLHEIRPLKRNVPQGVKALPVTKTIPAGAVPNL